MKTKKRTIKIELTPEQQEQVRAVTGKAASVLELTAEELEERVAPSALLATDPDVAEVNRQSESLDVISLR